MLKKILFVFVLVFSLGFFLNYSFWEENKNPECYNLFWDKFWNNSSCPILEQQCNEALPCKEWFTCSKSWFCEVWTWLEINNKEVTKLNSCLTNPNQAWAFWNAVCETCPCKYSFDFDAGLRSCDTLVPVITDKDQTKILDLWDYFQIK